MFKARETCNLKIVPYTYDGYELSYFSEQQSDYTIMLNVGYVGINFSITENSLVGISGVCPQNCFSHCDLSDNPFGLAMPGIVSLKDVSNLTAGTGCQLPYDFRARLDISRGILSFQITQKVQRPLMNIACAESLVVSLAGDRLASIWVCFR